MGTFAAIGIAGSGLDVYRKWIDAVSDNLANLNTVRSSDETALSPGTETASTNCRTVLRISSWMSLRPSVAQRRPMKVLSFSVG